MSGRGIRFVFGHGTDPGRDPDDGEERPAVYNIVISATVIAANKHNVFATVRAGAEHPTEAEGTLLGNIPVAISVTGGTLSSSSGAVTEIVDDTRPEGHSAHGTTPTRAFIFDPTVGGVVRYETPDGDHADYSTAPTPAQAYTITPISPPATGETNQTVQIVLEVTDDNNGDAVAPGVPVTIASGYPTGGGSAGAAGTNVTDASGRVTFNWTLGSTIGLQGIQFVIAATGDTSAEVSVDVSAPPVTGNVTMTEITTGGGTVGTAVQRTLEFRLVSDNSLVSGLVVAIASGYPTPSGSAVGGTTNAQGRVTVSWTMGAVAGSYNLRVSIPATGQTFDLTPATATAPTAGSSPHWRHARISPTDYRLNVQFRQGLNAQTWAAEMDFHCSVHDGSINGHMPGILARNPTFKAFAYDLFMFQRVNTSKGMLRAQEQWASDNGWDWEQFFLHHAAGQTVANFIETGSGGTVAGFYDHNDVFYPSHVADGNATLENRKVNLQFAQSAYWYYNPGYAGFRAWRAFRTQQIVAPGYAGCFFDSNTRTGVAQPRIFASGPALEYANVNLFEVDHLSLLQEQRQYAPAGYNLINQAQRFNRVEERPYALAAGGSFTEFTNMNHRDPQWSDKKWLTDNGVVVWVVGRQNDDFDDSDFGEDQGQYADIIERRVLWNYASYLMNVRPENMDLCWFDNYLDAYQLPMYDRSVWMDAFGYDIGLATSEVAQFRPQETDPTGQLCRIWRRNFESGVILIRRIEGGTTANGFSQSSAVSINLASELPGTWGRLRENGTPEPVSGTVTLRGGEALILCAI